MKINRNSIFSTRGENSSIFAKFREALAKNPDFIKGVGGFSWSYFQFTFLAKAPGGIEIQHELHLTFDEDTDTLESWDESDNLVYTQKLTENAENDVRIFIQNEPQIQKWLQQIEPIKKGDFSHLKEYQYMSTLFRDYDFLKYFPYYVIDKYGWKEFKKMAEEAYKEYYLK